MGLEALIGGVATLEQVIAAQRDRNTSPDISPLMDRLRGLVSGHRPSDGPQVVTPPMAQSLGEKESLIAEKTATGARAWQITFIPSAALVARGIDVNAVRHKLQALGEIAHSAPLIAPGGRIEFLFVLISRAAEQEVTAIRGDGLTCEPYRSKPAPAVEEAQERGAADAGSEGQSTHLTPGNVVRVDLQRLDELMRLVGELVLSRARLEDALRRLDAVAPPAEVRAVRETSAAIERQLRDLREGVMRVRMVPVREVLARMQFVVRDLVREIGKQVVLHFSGEETQIDKFVVERIMDPLLHLVRNAVSHGLELPEQRLVAGKPAEGHLHLRAKATGETVIIDVEDDGRGIDAEQVLAHARALGLGSQLNLEAASLLDVLCVPGFSTRQQSDRVSGRGIGMDVVRKSIEELGGSLALETSPGRGSRFEIQLPLTLAITDALIVKAGPERFAVPQVAVREIIRVASGSSTLIENNELLNYRKGVLPLVRLSAFFGGASSAGSEHYALVVGEGAQGIAIAVDRVLGLREIVVRPLTDRLVQVPHIAGATELGDGRVVLILDTANLSRGICKAARLAMGHRPAVEYARLREKTSVS
jgi:two-component system chemotaxis sensor kinase CheA